LTALSGNEINSTGRVLQGRFLGPASRSSACGANALMRFLFQRHDNSVETLDIGGANAMDNGAFQCG
jgi:hypothetical protein